MDGLYQLKNNLDENGIFLSFSGPISQNLMVELGEVLKKQMELAAVEASTILKVFSVLVEQSQNIIHYSAEVVPNRIGPEEKLMFGTIAVGYRDHKFFVLGGNKIKKEQENELKTRLTQIQSIGKQELKALYHKQRRQITADKTSSAGLGLIDLARKASEPIQFDFIPIDETYTFFSIRTLV
jgi:hypothetical protein